MTFLSVTVVFVGTVQYCTVQYCTVQYTAIDTGGNFLLASFDTGSMFPPVSTCVNDTGGKFAAGVNAIIANLRKDVTTGLIDTISEFSTSVNDTGGHIDTCVVDTGDAPLGLRISL